MYYFKEVLFHPKNAKADTIRTPAVWLKSFSFNGPPGTIIGMI